MGDLNVWGTRKSDINADEFCPECEREVPSHYNCCPQSRRFTDSQLADLAATNRNLRGE